MPTTAKTYHEGANDERTAILAKVRRLMKLPMSKVNCGIGPCAAKDLEQWLMGRAKRYRTKKGGL